LRAPAPSTGARDRAAPRDHMCKSWRQKKACPRLDAGLPCDFDHPADYVVQPKLCHQFTRTGHCNHGTTCRYEHSAAARSAHQAAEAPVDVIAPPAPAASAPPAAPATPPLLAASAAAAAAAAAPAAGAVPTPASSPTRSKRKAAEAATAADDGDGAARTATPKASPKKPRGTAAGLSTSVNSFAALDMGDDESMSPAPPLRQSSLSSLSLHSPSKVVSTSKKKAPSRAGATQRASSATQLQL
jgi:hypothetical protein